MRHILILIVSSVFLFASCVDPIVGGNPAASPSASPSPAVATKTATDIPEGYADVVKAAWILRAAGASRGLADTDPLKSSCTEQGSVYFFKDDNSLTQYESIDTAAYYDLKTRAKNSVECQNTINPGSPWDYIAIDPPAPPPVVYKNDPKLAQYEIAIVSNADDGEICQDWKLTNLADYNDALTKVGAMLEQWNTITHKDKPGHLVYGGV